MLLQGCAVVFRGVFVVSQRFFAPIQKKHHLRKSTNLTNQSNQDVGQQAAVARACTIMPGPVNVANQDATHPLHTAAHSTH